jgi:hypothetical protein
MVYEWDQTANDWSENWKINYEFDSSGNCIYRDRYNIDDSTKAFVLNWKNDYTYDDNGNLTYKISNNWDGIDSSWIKNYEQNYSYDAYGNTIFKNKLVWDTITNDWIGDYEENYLYDASGNALLKNKLVWDTTTNKFLTEHQTDYAYDFETQFSEIIYPSEYEYWHISNLKYFDQYANTMLQKTYSEQKNNQLEPTEVFNFYYSEKNITSTNNFAQQKIKVYPNPATNFIQFDGIEKSKQALVELYNLNGEKILSKEINKGRKLAISHLTSGMYLFKLTQDSQINLGKIIKK